MTDVFNIREFDDAEYKLQNQIRITTNVESFSTDVYTGTRWLPVSDYVVALMGYIRRGGET